MNFKMIPTSFSGKKSRASGNGFPLAIQGAVSLALAIILMVIGAWPSGRGERSTGRNFGGFGTVRDIDGNIYRTVTIGDQVWMAENLKVTRYRDGTAIPQVWDAESWSALKSGALCWQKNDARRFKDLFGALYNFYAVADSRGLAPEGWHIPSIEEWRKLETVLGGTHVAGGRMRDVASGLWKPPQFDMNDSSGFSARPAGGRGRLGFPGEAGFYATWWASTSNDESNAWHWGLFPDKPGIRSNPGHMNSGFSIRCLRDQKAE